MIAKQVLARVKELHAQGKPWKDIEADIRPLLDSVCSSGDIDRSAENAAFKSEPEYFQYRELRNAIIEGERVAKAST